MEGRGRWTLADASADTDADADADARRWCERCCESEVCVLRESGEAVLRRRGESLGSMYEKSEAQVSRMQGGRGESKLDGVDRSGSQRHGQ